MELTLNLGLWDDTAHLYAQWPPTSTNAAQATTQVLVKMSITSSSSVTGTYAGSSCCIATLGTSSDGGARRWLSLAAAESSEHHLATPSTSLVRSLIRRIDAIAQGIFGYQVWHTFDPDSADDALENQVLARTLSALLKDPRLMGIEYVPYSLTAASTVIHPLFSQIETVSQLGIAKSLSPNAYAILDASSILLLGHRILATNMDRESTQVVCMAWMVANEHRELTQCHRRACLGSPRSTCAGMSVVLAKVKHTVLAHSHYAWTLLSVALPPAFATSGTSLHAVLCPHIPKCMAELSSAVPKYLSPLNTRLVKFGTAVWPSPVTTNYRPLSIKWPKKQRHARAIPADPSLGPPALNFQVEYDGNPIIPLAGVGMPNHVVALTRFESAACGRTVCMQRDNWTWTGVSERIRHKLSCDRAFVSLVAVAVHVMPPAGDRGSIKKKENALGVWIHGIRHGQVTTVFVVTDDEPTDAFTVHSIAGSLV